MNTITPQETTQLNATHDQIAALAYQLWEKDGRQSYRDQEYWFQAEKQFTTDCASAVVQAANSVPGQKPVSQPRKIRPRGSNGQLGKDLRRA